MASLAFTYYKLIFGQGSAPDPARGAYNTLPAPLVGWGGRYSLPNPHLHRRLWRWGSVPSAASVTGPPTFQMLLPPMCATVCLWLSVCWFVVRPFAQESVSACSAPWSSLLVTCLAGRTRTRRRPMPRPLTLWYVTSLVLSVHRVISSV